MDINLIASFRKTGTKQDWKLLNFFSGFPCRGQRRRGVVDDHDDDHDDDGDVVAQPHSGGLCSITRRLDAGVHFVGHALLRPGTLLDLSFTEHLSVLPLRFSSSVLAVRIALAILF